MSSSNNTKKRRVGDTPTDNNNNELIAIKSSIDELVHQNRTQNSIEKLVHQNHTQSENILNMLQLMKGMQNEMKDMRGEITQLREKCDDMHTKLNENTDSTNHKLKYHDVLLQNQKWKYSARHPSNDYWNSVRGSDQYYEANRFISDIKRCTEEMRYGIGESGPTKDIHMNIPNHLSYHQDLLPHWVEFANALIQYRYHLYSTEQHDSALFLGGMELPDVVLDLLAKALESTYFHRLILKRNNFGLNGMDFALDYLESNHICKQFVLFDNQFKNMKEVKRLCQIIAEHPAIETLNLRDIAGGHGGMINGYPMLKMIITAGKYKLKSLGMQGNNIKTDGDTFISDCLAGNPILTNLDLTYNELDDNDVKAIAEALRQNTNLAVLDISINNFRQEGWDALTKAVFDKTSLNSAAESNHTCLIDFPVHRQHDEVRYLNGHKVYTSDPEFTPNPTCARQRKIYFILSARNRSLSNVDHFDEDMPVELLPQLLSSIQMISEYPRAKDVPPRDTRDAKPLSIMFEILQRWDKSLAVFEALSS